MPNQPRFPVLTGTVSTGRQYTIFDWLAGDCVTRVVLLHVSTAFLVPYLPRTLLVTAGLNLGTLT